MKNIPDSLTPAQAWSRLSACNKLDTILQPTSDNLLGFFLAEEIRVPEDVPVANRSFMDGFAVRSVDVKTAPVRLKIAGQILMGMVPTQKLNAGEAMFIPTGGFLPEGADAVVMQEHTASEQSGTDVPPVSLVHVMKSVSQYENVQLQAEDFKRNDSLFPALHRLRAQDLGALATFGISEVAVIRRPRVAIISTGNELIDYHSKPDKGQIRETNALTLAAACRNFDFPADSLGIIPDEFDGQKSAMSKALDTANVVLVSGGSSVGERDYTLEVIRSFPDSHVLFHGLAIRPGNPTIFASIGQRWVFGLPGQPVSSLIVFYQFVLPFLCHLSGETIEFENFLETKFRAVSATLDDNIKPLAAKTDYVRLRLRKQDAKWHATPVLGKSASLSTLAKADAFTVVPPGGDPLLAGAEITAIWFP